MRRKRSFGPTLVLASVCWVSAFASTTLGGELWTWTHEGAGQGTANVFDGGPVVTASSMSSPTSPGVGFAAVDRTRSGSQGATYRTAGSSRVDSYYDAALGGESLIVDVRFSTGYNGGSTSQGDHTGGEGGGSIWSVVEFMMPRAEIDWFVDVRIRQTSGFSGSTLVRFENVTQSSLLVEIASAFTDTRTLSGETGDLIRITTQIDGEGYFPPQVTLGFPTYESRLYTFFTVPEPYTVGLVLLGLATLSRKRRRT
ncbi:MAG: PEP-CTERM sorting domain-containing protein [Phycisphaerales bacterium]|nr:PEP-CTERM sorting domain-containing protein [Phycisphaerales bacterium]